MNYTQVIFKILEEERGYSISHYVALGYNRNTIKNWQRGKTSISLNELNEFLNAFNYSPILMLKRLADYEHKRTSTAA